MLYSLSLVHTTLCTNSIAYLQTQKITPVQCATMCPSAKLLSWIYLNPLPLLNPPQLSLTLWVMTFSKVSNTFRHALWRHLLCGEWELVRTPSMWPSSTVSLLFCLISFHFLQNETFAKRNIEDDICLLAQISYLSMNVPSCSAWKFYPYKFFRLIVSRVWLIVSRVHYDLLGRNALVMG